MRNLPHVWNPMKEFQNLQRRMDQFFGDWGFSSDTSTNKLGLTGPSFTPSCEVDETDSHYLMSFDLPGVKKEDIRIDIHENELKVSGTRKEEREEKERNRHWSERFFGSFERTFKIPASVMAEKIEATYADGVLRVTIPKGEEFKNQQVKIGEGHPAAWGKPTSLPLQKNSAA